MSKGFDNSAVGLSQLIAQTRTKTVPNTATAAGATIRADGANDIISAPAPSTIVVRGFINNAGEINANSALVRISYHTQTANAALINAVATAGTVRSIATFGTPLANQASAGATVEVTPGLFGAFLVTLTLSAASPTTNVSVTCNQDMVLATIAVG